MSTAFTFRDTAFLASIKINSGEDPDAAAYLNAVEVADGEALEAAVRVAINDFVVGCKDDGIWTPIKECCIVAGARTIDGATTPLKGLAPSVTGFIISNYDRKTGLTKTNSASGFICNRNNNADPQDNNHNAIWLTGLTTSSTVIMSTGSGTGRNSLDRSSANLSVRNRSQTANAVAGIGSNMLLGTSRASSSSYSARVNSSSTTISRTSEVPLNGSLTIFTPGATLAVNSRFAFYSIGESLDLALLDSRASALMTALDSAIL